MADKKCMISNMNLKIKFRESFRPFAPTVLGERAHEYFELDRTWPYMLLVAPIKKEQPSWKESETWRDELILE